MAAEGMTVQLTATGWSATMSGPLAQEQSAWLRVDFMRHAGVELREAALHFAIYGGWSRGALIDAAITAVVEELGLAEDDFVPLRAAP